MAVLGSDASLQVFDVKYLKEVFYVENGKVPSKFSDKDGGVFECITVSRLTSKSLLITSPLQLKTKSGLTFDWRGH